MSIFSNLSPVVVVGIMAGDEKKLHIHHWVWGLGFLGLYSLYPAKNTTINSLVVGTTLGAIAQGLSYSTSHLMLYDEDGFKEERANASED